MGSLGPRETCHLGLEAVKAVSHLLATEGDSTVWMENLSPVQNGAALVCTQRALMPSVLPPTDSFRGEALLEALSVGVSQSLSCKVQVG